jgi:hypothetical protein
MLVMGVCSSQQELFYGTLEEVAVLDVGDGGVQHPSLSTGTTAKDNSKIASLRRRYSLCWLRSMVAVLDVGDGGVQAY